MKKVLVLFVVLFVALTVFAQVSKNVQDQQACEYARRNNSAEIWQDYLKQFPQGMCAFEARSEIKKQSNNQNRIGGLHWSNRSPNTMNWYAAAQYCRNLREGGYSNWRLPNIDELRTTIKNCYKTEAGGQCKVSEKNGCLSWDQCCNHHLDDSCYCENKENNGGYYSKLGDDDRVVLWSSSTLTDDADNNYAWGVRFNQGFVTNFHRLSDRHVQLGENYYVRCVR